MDGIDALIDAMMDVVNTPLTEGVEGWVVEENGELQIRALRATNEGNGAISRYLDSLPHDRKVVVVLVVNEKLAAMLARRGFIERERFDPRFGNAALGIDGWGKIWLRRAGDPDPSRPPHPVRPPQTGAS